MSTHRQHVQGRLALDVHSDSQQTLNEWFKAKSPFSLALPASPAAPGEERPYRLEGARLVSVGGKNAAYIAYRMQTGPASLMAAPYSACSTKPIVSPDDLRGFKIRVPPSPLWTSMFEAFGSSPASINFNEVYSALQTKIVDGQENPLAIIATAKFYEVQKYCSLTNHMWDGFWFLANRRAWQALPDDVRAVVAKNVNAAALKERDDVAKLNATLQQDLAAKGLVFNQPDPAAFRDKLRSAGFYTQWKAKYGDEAWAILEKSVGKLA